MRLPIGNITAKWRSNITVVFPIRHGIRYLDSKKHLDKERGFEMRMPNFNIIMACVLILSSVVFFAISAFEKIFIGDTLNAIFYAIWGLISLVWAFHLGD